MVRYKISSFKPGKVGLDKVLGELGSQIMETVWRLGQATTMDILKQLQSTRNIAPSTVFTVVGRLMERGLLLRTKEKGVYVYRPALSREDFQRRVSQEVLSALLESCGEHAVASFIDVIEVKAPQKLEYLSRLIRERRRRPT